MTAPLDATTETLLRELVPQVLSITARRFGDFSDAEDATQEALVAASMQWPTQGVPANPRAWLIHVASKRMLDYARSESARRRREAVVFSGAPVSIDLDELRAAEEDDSLALLFMCAHPELPRSSAIALTLRAVGGLTTAEIANAYLVPEATMAQRITRAKAKIKASTVLFTMPADIERTERLAAVLHVLYLIFNEGYVSSTGPALQRRDLANEGIRLARMLYRLLPHDPEAAGLLALMLLTDARRMARTNAYGEIIPLEEQERNLWDRDQIAEGSALIQGVFGKGEVGPYQIQAAIAALHDDAGHADETDWAQILQLYSALERISDNPMVSLNRTVAVAMVDGPQRALELLEELRADKRVGEHYRFEAVRAHLLEMSGERAAAIAAYGVAARLTKNVPERNYLIARAVRLRDTSGALQ
jgi:RNA polymerase sigma factor (sigma-70 family)